MITVIHDDGGKDDAASLCLCYWRADLPCPNVAEWRVENMTNIGYSLMCTPHKEGFATLYPLALVRYITLYTPTS